MLYESYVNRVKKIAKVRKFLLRNKILIIILLSCFAVLLASFMGTKGVVTNVESPEESGIVENEDGSFTLQYGTELDLGANALFSDCTIEYFVNDEWTTTAPNLPGDYSIRVVTVNSFGNLSYSSEKKVTIEPKVINVTVEQESVVYGENPLVESVKAELVGNDKITEATFIYDEVNALDVTKANVTVSSVVITNDNGEDVTEYYDLEFVKSPIQYTPRPLKLKIIDQNKIYDGTPLTSEDYQLIDCEFVSDDTVLQVEYSGSQTNVGVGIGQGRVLKAYLNDVDITALYTFDYKYSDLVVDKRDITIKSNDASKVYDGTPLYDMGFTVIAGSLAEGDRISVTKRTEIINQFESNQANVLEYVILNKDGIDVSSNYNIPLATGVLVIEPYKITLSVNEKSKMYIGSDILHSEFGYTELLSGTTV